MSLASLIAIIDGKPALRVVFSDEFGANDDQFITVVAGVLLNLDKQYDPLIADIEAILTEVFKDAGKATAYEIKSHKLSYDLRHNRKEARTRGRC